MNVPYETAILHSLAPLWRAGIERLRIDQFIADCPSAWQDITIHQLSTHTSGLELTQLKAAAKKADGKSNVLAKIVGLPEPDREMAERLQAIIKASEPDHSSKIW